MLRVTSPVNSETTEKRLTVCRTSSSWAKKRYQFFCRATLCISAAYTVVRCLSICLSCLCQNEWSYFQTFFTVVYSHTIPYLTLWQYSDGDSITGTSNAEGMKKSRFSTNISLCLGNDIRQGHIYYRTLIGTRTRSIERCHFQWPWMTPEPGFKSHHRLTMISQKRYEIEIRSYNGMLIGTYTRPSQGCHFEWPWVT